MPSLSPTKESQRIWIMDALRGFAILGIFIANLKGFTLSFAADTSGRFITSFDKQMDFLHTMFIEGKFYSIFSFLFGWGIALQLSRVSSSGARPLGFVIRRLLIMSLLGLAHLILLWYGDIVFFYSIVAFVLILIRNWPTRRLFITAIILILSPILLYWLKMEFKWATAPRDFLFHHAYSLDAQLNNIKSNDEYYRAVHNADYWTHLKLNIVGFFLRMENLFFQSRFSKVLGLFILGFLLGRNERYKKILANTKLLWKIAIACLAVGLPVNYIFTKLQSTSGYYQLTPHGLKQTVAYAFGVAPLAIGYISLFFLAAKSKWGERMFKLISPVGKMAFTNYILHSIIGMIFFTGIGLAMDRQVGSVYYTIFALIVFIAQIILSKLWLRYFQFGPIEWLWRSATYGKKQKLGRDANI